MSPSRPIARLVAVASALAIGLAPLAQADRGRGHRGDDHDRHEYRDDDDYGRRGHYDDDDHRGRGRGHYRDRDHYRDYGYRDDYRHRPVVVYDPYYAPRSRVTITYGSSYGPYYYSGYRPRYDVGHYYGYAPRRTVYISDYDRYGLYEPPYGYHWVRDSDRGDAILASVATGAIIGLVIGAIATD
jgi:Ni/Co efflux regulator RcnB